MMPLAKCLARTLGRIEILYCVGNCCKEFRYGRCVVLVGSMICLELDTDYIWRTADMILDFAAESQGSLIVPGQRY
jgi:hypothetical protein